MDHNTLKAMQALADYGERLEAVTFQLATMFPEVPSKLAWKEAIFAAQESYRSSRPDLADLQLYVAERWLQLAKDGCLKPKMDQVRGLTVHEVFREEAPQVHASGVTSKHIEKLLFKQLNALPDNRLLQIYEVTTAFSQLTGESLQSFWDDFSIVVDDLCEKRYIRYDAGRGMPRFSKGIEFDSWKSEMTTKPSVPASAGHTFNFNGTVGAVQTGSHSVANVQQAPDSNQLSSLKSALEAVLAEIAKANLPAEARDEAQELIQTTIAEIEKPKPSKLSLRALLGGVATTVQTLGATTEAYKTLKAALTAFGVSVS